MCDFLLLIGTFHLHFSSVIFHTLLTSTAISFFAFLWLISTTLALGASISYYKHVIVSVLCVCVVSVALSLSVCVCVCECVSGVRVVWFRCEVCMP